MNKRLFISLSAGLLLSACATTQPSLVETAGLSLPSFDILENWQGETKVRIVQSSQIAWLDQLNEPELNNLFDQALSDNPNLNRLRARLNRAAAQSSRARADLQPVIDANSRNSRTDFIEGSENNSTNLSAGLNVSWSPDIWGRVTALKNAAQFRERAAQSDLEAAYQLLAANIAENYFLTIEAQNLADVSARNLEALNKTLGFVTVQYERGLRSGQDISLIRADVASAKVSFNRAKAAAREARRALEILVGDYPAATQLTETKLPKTPEFFLLDQPVNILTERPDLQAAKLRVEAAYLSHKAARKAVLPDLSLGGSFGGGSNILGQILDPTALASTLFANISAPIFDGGARKADIALAQSDIDEALANYQETALNAYREVERQIDEGNVLREQEAELQTAFSNANDALRFTEFRYESAETDLLNVLSVQQRVSFIEAQLVSTQRARLLQYVNLALATGVQPISEPLSR